jgi:hypothetical protein
MEDFTLLTNGTVGKKKYRQYGRCRGPVMGKLLSKSNFR